MHGSNHSQDGVMGVEMEGVRGDKRRRRWTRRRRRRRRRRGGETEDSTGPQKTEGEMNDVWRFHHGVHH